MKRRLVRNDHPFDRSWWFNLWFTLCALAGLVSLAVLGWLVLAAISWLNRH